MPWVEVSECRGWRSVNAVDGGQGMLWVGGGQGMPWVDVSECRGWRSVNAVGGGQ